MAPIKTVKNLSTISFKTALGNYTTKLHFETTSPFEQLITHLESELLELAKKIIIQTEGWDFHNSLTHMSPK